MAASEPRYAFVSYKREDEKQVELVVRGLVASGIPLWWDKSLRASNSWRAELEQKLRGAACVVVVWSERSVGEAGRFVRDEAQLALENKIPLIQVRIDDVRVPLGFGELQALDLFDYRGDLADQRFARLVSDVRGVLGLEQMPVPEPSTWRSRARSAIRRWTKPLIAAGTLVLGGAAGTVGWRAGADARLVHRLTSRLEQGARFDAYERHYAIDSLAGVVNRLSRGAPSKPAKRTEIADAHAKVVEFLAWRARRSMPLVACSSVVARKFAAELSDSVDVQSALSFLRGVRRASPAVGAVSLDRSNLQGMKLDAADLRGVSFRKACLDSTSFRDALLQGSVFSDTAEGKQTVFLRARLDSADLTLSAFVEATFNSACLARTNFAGAQLESSMFRYATILWANFAGASLDGTEGWTIVDSTTSHSLFVDATGLVASDSQWLALHGAIFSGSDMAAWWPLRNKTVATGAIGSACDPR
jgi:uncharacterized protein YjbI with pentapeptide repeats